jgi:large subunit ribosomal protein L24
MRKILSGDKVFVRSGKDKGKVGLVQKVIVSQAANGVEKVQLLVEGINQVHKHIRGNPQTQTTSEIRKIEKPIDASNVCIYNDKTKARDKVQIEVRNGTKVRVYRSTKEEIPFNGQKKQESKDKAEGRL